MKSKNCPEQLKDKIAVITGGSSGIGLATAKLFVGQGAHVYITGRRKAELDKAKAAIGNNVTAVQATSPTWTTSTAYSKSSAPRRR